MRGGVFCWLDFSLLRFFYQEKEMKRLKEPLPGDSKIFTFL